MALNAAGRRLAAMVLVAGAAALPSCSTATQEGTRGSTRGPLLAEEINALAASDAYQVVARLRPEWLRRRGPISVRDPGAGEVVVYVDGVRFGGAQSLRSIEAQIIERMERLDANDATTRFGTGHGGGAILVTTR